MKNSALNFSNIPPPSRSRAGPTRTPPLATVLIPAPNDLRYDFASRSERSSLSAFCERSAAPIRHSSFNTRHHAPHKIKFMVSESTRCR